MQTGFWARVDALRWTSLGLWLCSWALIVCYWSIPEALATPEVLQWKPVMRAIYCLCQWAPILTVCGFGYRHLNFDSAKRRYLTEAVFPVYILHQTLIVSMAHWMKPIKLAPGIEGTFLIVLTFGISFGVSCSQYWSQKSCREAACLVPRHCPCRRCCARISEFSILLIVRSRSKKSLNF